MIKSVSWEHMHGGVRGYDDMDLRVFAEIELEDGPYVTAEIIDIPRSDLKHALDNPGWEFWDSLVGKKVRMVVRRLRKLDNGNISYGYKFVIEK